MFDIIKNKGLVSAAREKGFDVLVLDEDIAVVSADRDSELRKKIAHERKSGKIIAVLGSDDEINRLALRLGIDFLLSPEIARRKDFFDYRNSGLNQVLCKEAAENNIAVAFNFSDILNLDNETKALRLGRMMQNVRLCRKFHVPMILATFASSESELRTPRELVSFGISIGMTRADAEKALNHMGKIISKQK